ncbi:hypothetical protein HNY73_012240 [Argiope bruennichi]|uniref:Uncharacterized protein n=1 Tax=Argiope bruennichi TaxID=94029 RepID=A0A8T0EZ31_ARGBR|nr:hypothetical protein HNY73_012240 [Argiope bruennichi]
MTDALRQPAASQMYNNSHRAANTTDNHSFKCCFCNGRNPTAPPSDACLSLIKQTTEVSQRINDCGFVANFRLNPEIYERVVGYDSS